ncbi:MAG TPA: sialidase family protein [Candidatus Sumerlaeota bacterium]|nr:sialidase family protein [Candidatus Sumerlaeota bacterium]
MPLPRVHRCLLPFVLLFALASCRSLSLKTSEPVGPGAPVAVFTPHEQYAYRIPALLATPQGALLAFAERRIGLGDHAQNDIVLRRSLDSGRTWLDEQMIDDRGGDSLNDPCAVVERKSGRVFLMYVRYPKGFHSDRSAGTQQAEFGYDGPRNTQVFLRSSDDAGATWSEPLDLTRIARRADVISTGSPGVGIQLTHGPHQGRLLFPLYETLGGGKWRNAALYSDDAGQTWRLSERVPIPNGMSGNGNEAQIVELSDGAVLLNARNEGGPRVRMVTRSRDGGQTWDVLREEPDLPTVACMGSLLRLPKTGLWFSDTPPALLCSLPGAGGRRNGTLHVSRDDGQTWTTKKTLYPGGFAYSCLALLPDGRVGCLFEPENYRNISLLTFDAAWATQP